MRRAESKRQFVAAAKLTRKTNEPQRSQRKALGGEANQIYLGTSHHRCHGHSSDQRAANNVKPQHVLFSIACAIWRYVGACRISDRRPALAPRGFSHPAALSACQRSNARPLPHFNQQMKAGTARVYFSEKCCSRFRHMPRAMNPVTKKRTGLQVWGPEMTTNRCIYRPLTCGYETY